jgi:HK97 family phage portal protein
MFPVDTKSGASPILHLRTFNPDDDHYGLSPLEPGAYGVDIHNAAANWNKALLDNAARPSGALMFEPSDGSPANLSEEQFRRLKDELEENYKGAINAGRPFLLEGGLKWQQLSLTPHDMEFIQSKNVSAREIALAFGVPPMILGIPGDNTYANYQEANRALWRLTLLPMLEKMCSGLNNWLSPRFGQDIRIEYDKDAIPALTFERDQLWNRITMAPFLTPNEKRKILGFEAVDGGDALAGANPFQPAPNIKKKN